MMREHGGVRFGLILFLVVILAGLAAGGFWWWREHNREYLLRLQLKPGDTLRYAFEMNMSAQGRTMQLSFLMTMKVLKVQKDGSIVIRTQMESGMLKANGVSTALPLEPPRTDTYRPNGRRVGSGRVASPLTEFVEASYPDEPVKIGSTWSERQKAPDGSTLEAGYRVEGRERVLKRDTLRLAVTVRDVSNPSAPVLILSGHQWVDLSTGMSVREEGQIHQVRLPWGSTMSMEGNVKMRLLSP
jgi:hypothetical protein